jgi:hypothetical protein
MDRMNIESKKQKKLKYSLRRNKFIALKFIGVIKLRNRVSCQMKMMAALYLIPNRLQVLGKLICLI